MKTRRRILFSSSIFLLSGLTASFNACTNAKLTGGVNSFNSIASNINVCTTKANTIKTNLKFMFVVDRSGSNTLDLATDGHGNPVWDVTGKGYTTCPGTTQAPIVTPTKQFCVIADPRTQAPYPVAGTDVINCATGGPCTSRRFDPISAMAQQYPQDTSIYWSLVTFADNATIQFPAQTGNNPPTFSNDNAGFQSAVTFAKTKQHEGNYTNYLEALKQVASNIQNDVLQEQAAAAANNSTVTPGSSYVIFFISDGAPWIVDPAGQNPFGILEKSSDIQGQLNVINGLVAQYPDWIDSVTVNSAYYYRGSRPTGTNNYDPDLSSFDYTADALMGNMAQWGSGRYLDFGAGQNVDLSRFQVPTRTAKFSLLDLWVKDINTVWWQGQLMRDSDGDGLPDQIEIAAGSDPNNRDTDGDGVSDGVYYSVYQTPCQGGNCAQFKAPLRPADPPPVCPVNSNVWNAATRKYTDTDNDFLNDCEEAVLGSDPRAFDSNKDLVPDYIEFLYNVAFTTKQGSNLTAAPDGDGISNYLKMKYNYPTGIDYRKVSGLQQLGLSRVVTSDDPTQTCYAYSVNNLVTSSYADTIRVMMVEQQQGLGSKIMVRTAERPLVGGSVQFNDNDFH